MRRFLAIRSFATDTSAATSAGSVDGPLRLSLTTPASAFYKGEAVKSVLIPAHTGAMVILARHIPTIAQLRPGLVAVQKEDSAELEKYFVSGGYAFVHADNTCSVNAVEAIPLAELDVEAARAGLAKYEQLSREAQNDEERALASIGIQVHQAMVHALQ